MNNDLQKQLFNYVVFNDFTLAFEWIYHLRVNKFMQ